MNIPGNKIRLTVSVMKFEPHGMFDHFSDGTHAAYAITLLKVIGPARYEGRHLQVVHESQPAPDSVWVGIGRQCSIDLDAWFLDDPETYIDPKDVQISCN